MNKYLEEAIRIGNQILDKGIHTSHGLTWETLNQDANSITYKKSETIYMGVSGIVLFLLELYKTTQDKKFLQASSEGMRWVEWYCKHHPTNNYSFIGGRMGVSFTFLQMYRTTANKTYLNKSLRYAKDCKEFLQSANASFKNANNDYLSGDSGTIIALLHLHQESQQKWILSLIKKYVKKLFNDSEFGKVGICWNDRSNPTKPLCGFSHGAGGIGLAFLELGKYFNRNIFFAITKQTIVYEDYYYNRRENNWPLFYVDYNNAEEMQEYLTYYQNNNFKRFDDLTFQNTWCHGAAGIGLLRLKAYQYRKSDYLKNDIKRVLTKILKDTKKPRKNIEFGLCHGLGSFIDFLLLSSVMLHKPIYKKIAFKIADMALLQKNMRGEYYSYPCDLYHFDGIDLSLFTGLAGIGYMLLRLANPSSTSSILLLPSPKENSQKKKIKIAHISLTDDEVKTTLVKKLFPHVKNVSTTNISTIKDYTVEKEKLIELMRQQIIKHGDSKKEMELFTLDKSALRLQERKFIKSNKYCNPFLLIQEHVRKQQITTLLKKPLDEFMKISLAISSTIIVVPQKNNHRIQLVKLSSEGISMKEISPFCREVLLSFKEKTRVQKIMDKMTKKYSSYPNIREVTYSQISYLLQYQAIYYK